MQVGLLLEDRKILEKYIDLAACQLNISNCYNGTLIDTLLLG